MSVKSKPGTAVHADGSKISETDSIIPMLAAGRGRVAYSELC